MKRIVFDSETTGLEAGSRVVELYSALLDDAGSVVDEFQLLIHPGMPIPADVTLIHGITDADVSCDPAVRNDTATALKSWLSWLTAVGAEVGIAHNAPYDVGVLSYELERCGLVMPSIQVMDTCAMAKAIKATKKNSLAVLVDHYGIVRHGDAHRAKGDALACRDYFLIAQKLTTPEVKPWAATYHYPKEVPPVIAGLPLAIAKGQLFSFKYVDAQNNRTSRTIMPYGFAQEERGIGVSFHGLCTMRGERRTFLAERVQA